MCGSVARRLCASSHDEPDRLISRWHAEGLWQGKLRAGGSARCLGRKSSLRFVHSATPVWGPIWATRSACWAYASPSVQRSGAMGSGLGFCRCDARLVPARPQNVGPPSSRLTKSWSGGSLFLSGFGTIAADRLSSGAFVAGTAVAATAGQAHQHANLRRSGLSQCIVCATVRTAASAEASNPPMVDAAVVLTSFALQSCGRPAPASEVDRPGCSRFFVSNAQNRRGSSFGCLASYRTV